MGKIYKYLAFVLLVLLSAAALFIFFLRSTAIDLDKTKVSLKTYVTSAEATRKMIVYELHTTEKITKTQKLNMLWKLISISDVNIDMLVPVKYAYYIDFNEGFDIQKSGEGIKIIVPPLKSYEPVVDVSGIAFVVNEAPFFYDTKKVQSQILSQLTDYLNQKSEVLKGSYTEPARSSVRGLVAQWLKSDADLKNIDPQKVQIEFKNESAPGKIQ